MGLRGTFPDRHGRRPWSLADIFEPALLHTMVQEGYVRVQRHPSACSGSFFNHVIVDGLPDAWSREDFALVSAWHPLLELQRVPGSAVARAAHLES
ncbi:MAG: hypothetical protein AUG44_08170 [Actinobacteria bacterium 13_1_20CM_3_71_11]|nr:MAG: hypothetical protein AUG44_08170 [Actinobacteria bacterium 13_1_20CM_3_71_11]